MQKYIIITYNSQEEISTNFFFCQYIFSLKLYVYMYIPILHIFGLKLVQHLTPPTDRALMYCANNLQYVHTYKDISKFVIFYNKRLLLLRNLFVIDLTPRHNFTLLQNVLQSQRSILHIGTYVHTICIKESLKKLTKYFYIKKIQDCLQIKTKLLRISTVTNFKSQFFQLL